MSEFAYQVSVESPFCKGQRCVKNKKRGKKEGKKAGGKSPGFYSLNDVLITRSRMNQGKQGQQRPKRVNHRGCAS